MSLSITRLPTCRALEGGAAAYCRRHQSSSVNAIAMEGFGRAQANRYQSARPSYTQECIKTVSDIIADGISSPAKRPTRILEIAAGTGKFTQSFIRHSHLRERTSNIDYIATEPSEGFLEKLRELIAAEKTPWRVSACIGAADSIPIKERNSVDAIIAAQAFHWFSRQEALEAFHQSLRPGGPLVLAWNFFDTGVEWIHELEHSILTPIYDKIEAASGETVPRYINGRWRDVFETARARELFSPLKSSSSLTVHQASEDTIVDRILSTSVVASLPQEEQAAVERRVRELLRAQVRARVSGEGEATFDLQYKTNVVWAYALQ